MTAADKLRALAQAASGVWYGESYWSALLDADDEQLLDDADCRYLAALSPDVALALADLLDATVPLLELASVSFDGDPWFAIDIITKAEDALARVEEALG